MAGEMTDEIKPVKGTYVASRASVPERSARWRRLRDVDGYVVTASWIDEAGPGQSASLGDLWTRITAEVARSERLVLYVEPDDFPLKGALVEVGMAIALGVPVYVVAPGVTLDPVSLRPLGSWVAHPLVRRVDSVEQALVGAARHAANLAPHASAQRAQQAFDALYSLSDKYLVEGGRVVLRASIAKEDDPITSEGADLDAVDPSPPQDEVDRRAREEGHGG